MTAATTWDEPFLPWVESQNDRRFRQILLITVVIFAMLGSAIPFMPLPEVERKELKDVSPRLAKLILEKKKIPPPPPPKPKVVKKEVTKKAVRPKKQVAQKPLTKKQADARKVAERSGLIAMRDELADLRESFDMAALTTKPQKERGTKATTARAKEILTANASKGSGGIDTNTLTRKIESSELASRATSSVDSAIGSAEQLASTPTGEGRGAMRSAEEIEIVFQKNKGAIFSIYNRALRKDPSLQGKVVLELTISPEGAVINCIIASSELNDPALERKLVSRIKLFKFAARDVAQVTITYPIDFLPS